MLAPVGIDVTTGAPEPYAEDSGACLDAERELRVAILQLMA
jgi:hypothetical protein